MAIALANGPASAYASMKDNLDLALSADFFVNKRRTLTPIGFQR